MLTVPVRVPAAVGVNVRVKVEVVPGASVVGTVPLKAKSPVVAMPVMARLSVELLLEMVKVTGAEELPTSVLAKPL